MKNAADVLMINIHMVNRVKSLNTYRYDIYLQKGKMLPHNFPKVTNSLLSEKLKAQNH